MNGPTRKKLYAVLAAEHGEYCRCCGLLPSEGQLVIDHKDNDNSNNSIENLQLLCRRCNYHKNPRLSERPFDMCERIEECEDETELQNSKKNEPLFRKYVFSRLNENGNNPIPEKDLLNGGAEHIGNSPVTCKRYLEKMCSAEGVLHKWRSVKTIVVGYKSEAKYA